MSDYIRACIIKEILQPLKVLTTGAIIHELKKEKLRVYSKDININSLNFPYKSRIMKKISLFNNDWKCME